MIKEAEDDEYHAKCDNIDKMFGDLERLAQGRADREFQIFWANLEVLKPTVYSRAPVPVVTPRFKDRKDLPRRAAEVLERSLISDVEQDDIHSTLQMVRDDLLTTGRGLPWIRLAQAEGEALRAICEHVDRKDFRHGPARKWREVPWVSRRSYVNSKVGMARFGEIFLEAQMKQANLGVGDDDTHNSERTAEVWEIWHKEENVVVWVTEGVDEVLDIRPPILDLEGFFPCTKPAYSTVERSTLRPIPDVAYYKDQIEEVNELTARISALSEALMVKGFFPQGQKDVGDAVRQALDIKDNRMTLVGIPNMQSFATGAGGKLVEWFPVEVVAQVIAQLVELRRQLIEDIYQITGISDIMRGETEASETLGAQNLKAQFGNIRVRKHQEEIVRVARDIMRMKAEIMAEHFDGQTLLEMSQVDDLPSAAQVQAQLQQQVAAAQQDPQMMQMAQQNPEQAQAMLQQAQQQAKSTVTIEAVMELLKNQRLRPFILEIETDSTIQPNEDAEKQRRTEFLGAIGAFFQQALPLVTAMPQAAPMAAEMLKFTAGGFRAGREMDGVIDEFAEQVKGMAQAAQQEQQGPSPEEQQAQAEMEMKQAEMQAKQQEAQAKLQMDQQARQAEMAMEERRMQMEQEKAAAQIEIEREKVAAMIQLEREKAEAEIELKREIAREDAEIKRETAAAQAQIARKKAASNNGDAREH